MSLLRCSPRAFSTALSLHAQGARDRYTRRIARNAPIPWVAQPYIPWVQSLRHGNEVPVTDSRTFATSQKPSLSNNVGGNRTVLRKRRVGYLTGFWMGLKQASSQLLQLSEIIYPGAPSLPPWISTMPHKSAVSALKPMTWMPSLWQFLQPQSTKPGLTIQDTTQSNAKRTVLSSVLLSAAGPATNRMHHLLNALQAQKTSGRLPRSTTDSATVPQVTGVKKKRGENKKVSALIDASLSPQGVQCFQRIGGESVDYSGASAMEAAGRNMVKSQAPANPGHLYSMHYDGGFRQAPLVGGSGVVIKNTTTKTNIRLACRIASLPNSQAAEYCALLLGLAACDELGIRHLHCMGDCLSIKQQLGGEGKVRLSPTQPYYEHARTLLEQMRRKGVSIQLSHVPREHNKEADRLSSESITWLGMGPKKGKLGM